MTNICREESPSTRSELSHFSYAVPLILYDSFMKRRDLACLLPLLPSPSLSAAKPNLPSATFPFDSLPVKDNGQNKSRAVLNGTTHTGYPIEMHITELAAGMMPHPPHSHEHEEMMCLLEGTLDVTIAGKTSRLGPGSSAFIASQEHHGWKNIGESGARYFVFAFGRDS